MILSADDPYMFSSQNEQDNRYYGKLSGLPILQPSSPQEAKEMVQYGFELSEQLKEPVILRTTTRLNHSIAPVTLGKIKKPKTLGDFLKDPFNYVTVPAVSRNIHVKLLKNIEKAKDLSCDSKYNFITGKGPWGIVCNGVSYNYVADAVKDLELQDRVRVLRIGFSHPHAGYPDQVLYKRMQADSGGGGRGTLHGGVGQGPGPGGRLYLFHQGKRFESFLPAV